MSDSRKPAPPLTSEQIKVKCLAEMLNGKNDHNSFELTSEQERKLAASLDKCLTNENNLNAAPKPSNSDEVSFRPK